MAHCGAHDVAPLWQPRIAICEAFAAVARRGVDVVRLVLAMIRVPRSIRVAVRPGRVCQHSAGPLTGRFCQLPIYVIIYYL